MKTITFLIVVLSPFSAFTQAKIRKLPQIINHPAMNLFAPFISLDEQTLLFTTDYGDENTLTVYFTVKSGIDWIIPKPMPAYVNNRINFVYGYTLSPDGKTIFLSSLKSGGVGGYDILMGTFKQGNYTELSNPGMPINSRLNDASPTLTPDGKTMYFMRCETMNQTSCSACRIFSTVKNNLGQWGEATALPATINTGNSQFPRIMADGQTLIFSSNTMPNSKGMDLYMVRLKDGIWANPEALTFVNTDGDDSFVSVSALGRYLLRSSKGQMKNELVEYLFPPDQKPTGVLKVDGLVKDAGGQPLVPYLSVTDVASGKRILSTRPENDGSFTVYLPEGARYLLAADPERSEYTYFLQPFDLTGDPPLTPQHIEIQLGTARAGDTLMLNDVLYQPYTAQLDPASGPEISRLARLIKGVPGLKFNLHVALSGYREDSIQSDPDLTQIRYDSTYQIVERTDTVVTYYPTASELAMPGAPADTLHRYDSLSSSPGESKVHIEVTSDTVLFVRVRYHNDRTTQQAGALEQALVAQGVDPNQLTISSSAVPEDDPEKRGTTATAVLSN